MSYGQALLGTYLNMIIGDSFLQNHRPRWLHGLELDFYYPDLNVAFEFQGDQHLVSSTTFGSCKPQQKRDWLKSKICKECGICLLRITARDLQYGVIRSKLRRCGIWKKRKVSRSERKDIDTKSRQYRQKLLREFDSPTATKGVLRKRAVFRRENAFRQAKGLPPLVPTTPRQVRLLQVNPIRQFTEAEIEAGRSSAGGFTRDTLKSWGVPWPPPRHWKKVLMRGPERTIATAQITI